MADDSSVACRILKPSLPVPQIDVHETSGVTAVQLVTPHRCRKVWSREGGGEQCIKQVAA